MSSHDPKIVQIGTPQFPLPTYDASSGETSVLASVQGVLSLPILHKDISKSGAPEITDDADRITAVERAYSNLMQNLPSRGMLPHLMHELVERDPNRVDWDKHSFVCRYEGPPSIGKSFMIKTLNRIVHPKGGFNLNCKDVDMGVIFCETVFDTRAANKEKAAIDAKILQGNSDEQNGLSEASRSLLSQNLGDAYIEEERDGKTVISIDWNGIQVKGETAEQQMHHAQVLKQMLADVCENEGIELSSGAGQIGITTRDGIAIRAADPKSADYGRPILLDESLRCKPGTQQKLYEFYAMLADPKVDSFEVIGGENRPFTFRRKDLPETYRVNLTDNPATARMGNMSGMDAPLQSRFGVELDTRLVPDPDIVDYADRIAGSLTGVPLMQLYYAGKDHFDANPEAFVEIAKQYRVAGRTEAELRNIPAEEMLNISIAPKIIELSEQLAKCFAGLDLADLASDDSSHEYDAYLEKLDIDLRTITKLIEKASVVMPTAHKAGTFNFASAFGGGTQDEPLPVKVDEDDKLASRGTRLEEYVVNWFKRIVCPADAKLRGIDPEEMRAMEGAVLGYLNDFGIGRNINEEAAPGGIQSIASLYNFKYFTDKDSQLTLMRDLMVDSIRTQHADRIEAGEELPELPKSNNDIISLDAMHVATEHAIQIRGASIHSLFSGHTNALVAPNPNPEALAANPFPFVAVKDGIPEDGAQAVKPKVTELLNHDMFILALALPDKMDSSRLNSLWNEALANHPKLAPDDHALKLAADLHETKFAITTVMVEKDGEAAPIHILKSKDVQQTLIVGGEIDRDLERLLRSQYFEYVNVNEPGAAFEIDRIFREMATGLNEQEELKKRLVAAFLLRNGMPANDAENRALSLEELLTSPDKAPPTIPVYATKEIITEAMQSEAEDARNNESEVPHGIIITDGDPTSYAADLLAKARAMQKNGELDPSLDLSGPEDFMNTPSPEPDLDI